MKVARLRLLLAAASLLLLAACATRPVNPPLKSFDPGQVTDFGPIGQDSTQKQTLVILAFSGGGTRAASFSYGVLETLRDTEVTIRDGRKGRLLDQVDVITGVSGGSFTALAYRLYGDRLFDIYEKGFLKRNVQGEIVARSLNPLNWGELASTGWGRSELAANLYDEILFKGATFGDLRKTNGPYTVVGATDITSGARLLFVPTNFAVICANLDAFRIARAAAASSAVPVVLSPLTINNYGGTCGFQTPPWAQQFLDSADPPRPAARVVSRLRELEGLGEANEPYLHLVDGGVADNLGLRSVLDTMQMFEALHTAGQKTPLDGVRNVIVFVVNSLSIPDTNWSQKEDAPGPVTVMVKAAGVPIDRYSGEQVEQLKDLADRWKNLGRIRASAAFAATKDPSLDFVRNAPDAKLYVIDVSFAALKDSKEQNYLNQLPTSFVLPDEAVDRLRAAARTLILDSPDFQRLLKDTGSRITPLPAH